MNPAPAPAHSSWGRFTRADCRCPIGYDHTMDGDPLPEGLRYLATIPPPLPEGAPSEPERSPEWHLAEAEEHLVEADVLASAGSLGEATARLLAASANANIAALKVALRQEQLLHEIREQSHAATSLLDTIQHKTT
jgi:hypothetical protein